MHYKSHVFRNTVYAGYQITVDLSQLEETDFTALWNQVMKETHLKENDFYIGYEAYYKEANKTMMTYYALAPVSSYVNPKHQNLITKTLKKGTYLLFENTLENHGPNFFKKVYAFVKSQNIEVDYSFDLEVIPNDFNRENQDSLIYVGLLTT